MREREETLDGLLSFCHGDLHPRAPLRIHLPLHFASLFFTPPPYHRTPPPAAPSSSTEPAAPLFTTPTRMAEVSVSLSF